MQVNTLSENMNKVLSFGELLLRFSPGLNGAWISEAAMPVYVGGAELNVATALAAWGLPVAYCTALPNHYLAKELSSILNTKGIDTTKLLWQGHRIGTYYLPQGADLKNAGVIYDRVHSSFWSLQPGQIDWDMILQGIDWFHFSAISPALNQNVAAICLEAVEAASQKGITISVDLNFRPKLWQWGKQPAEIMPALVQHCHVVMGNIWAAETMLNIPLAKDLKMATKQNYLEQAHKTSEALIAQFSKCRQVANTFRFDEGDGIRYYATLFEKNQLYVAAEQHAGAIVDKAGSGDCFMAGLIWSAKQNYATQQALDFAATAAFEKLFIKGDATTASAEVILQKAIAHAE